MNKIKGSLIIILVISSCYTSENLFTNNSIKNRIYIIEGNYNFFQFISTDSVLWVSRGDNDMFYEDKHKYKIRQDTLEIIQSYPPNPSTDTFLLKYFPKEDYFLDVNDLDAYWRTTCVTYSKKRKWCE